MNLGHISSTEFPVNNGLISLLNSTSTILDPGDVNVFTGDAEDLTEYGTVIVSVFSDVASATDGLSIEYSSDGTNWDHTDVYTVPAGTGKNYSVQRVAKFFRIVYTNGGVIQAEFRLQVIFNKSYIKPSSHRIQDTITSDDDAELMKSVITGENPDGNFNNVKINNEAALSVTDYYYEVARGNVPGSKMYSIPGRKDSLSNSALDDLTQIPGTIVVPEPGGIQLELVSSAAADDSVGSGIQTIDIHYLDTSDAEQVETVIMDGTNPVDTVAVDIDFVQWIHAASVGSGGVAAGNISLRNTAGTITYEYISAGGNQSLSAKIKVPAGKTGYVMGWQASGITKKIDIRLRATVERFNRTLIPGVFLFQDVLVLNDMASGWIPFLVPLMMPATAVVKLSGISSAAGGDASGQFDIMFVDD